ncbi:MAG: hypothetical protein WCS18_11615 [Sphaerochaetaceae bacterium]
MSEKQTIEADNSLPPPLGSAGWAISLNEETYDAGVFKNEADAIEEGTVGYNGVPFWLAKVCSPTPPENLFDVEDWLERVACDDDYAGDWAEDWDMSTKEQRTELEREVRAVIAAWLDRNNLRPTFFNVKDARLIDPNTGREAR